MLASREKVNFFKENAESFTEKSGNENKKYPIYRNDHGRENSVVSVSLICSAANFGIINKILGYVRGTGRFYCKKWECGTRIQNL